MERSNKRAIIFLAWGERYLNEMLACLNSSVLPPYPVFFITDHDTAISHRLNDINVIQANFTCAGKTRKSEMLRFLPKENFSSYLFLDTDVRVLSDISFGFEKAERHGIAMAQAPHYSLDHFFGFEEIMIQENIPLNGQLQYNTGVIFFSLRNDVIEVFTLWERLAKRYSAAGYSDQPYFTLALEKLNFNPYTLSPSYNHRAFGELISGTVRIWHSHSRIPPGLNSFSYSWPPRRIKKGKIEYMK